MTYLSPKDLSSLLSARKNHKSGAETPFSELARTNQVWERLAGGLRAQNQGVCILEALAHELCQRIRTYPSRQVPEDIQGLLNKAADLQNLIKKDNPLSIGEVQRLKAFIKARDTIVVWERVGKAIGIRVDFPRDLYDSSNKVITQASVFNSWKGEWSEALSELQELKLEALNLTTFDSSPFPGLKILSLAWNGLKVFDASRNPKLVELNLSCNQLKAFDASGNPLLRVLNLWRNQLSVFDSSKNSQLVSLDISCNHLEMFDGSGNPSLKVLYLFDNRLKEFDASRNPNLDVLDVSNNQLKKIVLSKDHQPRVFKSHGNPCTSLKRAKPW